MEQKKEKLREENDKLKNDYLNEREEPNRLDKQNNNKKIAVDHLKKELETLKKEADDLEAQKNK